jgi:hypothetical protein
MNALTPESEQREYIERAAAALLELQDQMKRQAPAPMPQYERD